MIVGRGQIAQAFMRAYDNEDILIFARGVSNSGNTDVAAFEKEKTLLLSCLNQYPDKKIYYFSSCALIEDRMLKIPYYQHKKDMEEIVRQHANYMICRLPQVFGKIKEHPTLINFLFNHIKNHQRFDVWKYAFRYVIHLDDIPEIVAYIEENDINNKTVDIANPYRYSVLNLVRCIETIIGQDACINILNKEDGYVLNLDFMYRYVQKYKINDFGEFYFCKKMKSKA